MLDLDTSTRSLSCASLLPSLPISLLGLYQLAPVMSGAGSFQFSSQYSGGNSPTFQNNHTLPPLRPANGQYHQTSQWGQHNTNNYSPVPDRSMGRELGLPSPTSNTHRSVPNRSMSRELGLPSPTSNTCRSLLSDRPAPDGSAAWETGQSYGLPSPTSKDSHGLFSEPDNPAGNRQIVNLNEEPPRTNSNHTMDVDTGYRSTQLYGEGQPPDSDGEGDGEGYGEGDGDGDGEGDEEGDGEDTYGTGNHPDSSLGTDIPAVSRCLELFADAIANSYGFGEKEAHLRENLHGFLKVRFPFLYGLHLSNVSQTDGGRTESARSCNANVSIGFRI